jgi:hypothetical protein
MRERSCHKLESSISALNTVLLPKCKQRQRADGNCLVHYTPTEYNARANKRGLYMQAPFESIKYLPPGVRAGNPTS